MSNTQKLGFNWRGRAWDDGEPIPRVTLPDGSTTEAIAALGYAWDATNGVWVKILGDSTNGIKVQSSKVALTPANPTAATVGVVTAQAVAVNTSRKGLVLVNTSSNRISLGLGVAAVLDSGITLIPNGGTWVMDDFTFCTSVVNAIASAATSNLAIQEWS